MAKRYKDTLRYGGKDLHFYCSNLRGSCTFFGIAIKIYESIFESLESRVEYQNSWRANHFFVFSVFEIQKRHPRHQRQMQTLTGVKIGENAAILLNV